MTALQDVFVVDITDGVAGAYAGRLLADLGADVVKVEPPGGDTLRRLGPFPRGVPDAERSGLHLHFNANKRGVVLDLDTDAGRARLHGLLTRADIVLNGFTAERADDLALRHDVLGGPIVVGSVTPFGTWGPYAGWKSDEIVEWAMGGWMSFYGDPDREPLLVGGYQAQLHAGQLLTVGVLAALQHARATGLGQDVEVSHVESMAMAQMIHTASWTQEGRLAKRTGVNALRCKDGFVEFTGPLVLDAFLVLIEREELFADDRFATAAARMRNAKECNAMLAEWVATKTKQEIEERGQELRIPTTASRTIDELACGHPQMEPRGFMQTIEHPVAGPLRHPGFPYKLSATPCTLRRPAPTLGQHTQDVFASLTPRPVGPATPRRIPEPVGFRVMRPIGERDPNACLAGLKVLEATVYWGGPLAGRFLGELGADVIKVEYAERRARRSPGGAAAIAALVNRDRYNRGILQNKMNRAKRGVALNLGLPEGRETFLRLVAWADVVIENNSARVMPNFGLAYDDLRAVKPDVIMLSMSAFGATGPWRDYMAFGSNIELSSGMFSLAGYSSTETWKSGSFYADPVGGNLAAVAILAALEHRRRTGEGQLIDLSLNEAGAGMFAEAFMQRAMNGVAQEPMGARSARWAPQGAYKCAGADSWVALTVRDEIEWDALCSVVELSDHRALRTAEARRAKHDDIDAAISAWSSSRHHHRAAAQLQAAGVPAAPVLTNREAVRDPHLFDRGFFVFIRQPGMGVLPYPSWPWQMSRTPASVNRHPPLYAEHNREVFGDVLGMSDEEIEQLYKSGATVDEDYSDIE